MFNNFINSKVLSLFSFAMIAFGFSFILSVTSSQTTHAAFSAGNIISNNVFTNYNSMNATQIQQFLNNKNSVCLKDTNKKYASLVDDNGDGVVADSGAESYGRHASMTAAQLINAAAKIYKINPQVILVTLQKEQGLVTRTDCPQWRYDSALGYDCPDSTPNICGGATKGFVRQIDYGAYHFRGFYNDSLTTVPFSTGNHRIYYNPNPNCGYSTVNIQNRATAALYSYTPYQPNAATIAAAAGQEVHCGAYGNINFWRFFTSWFGSTQGGPAAKQSGDSLYAKSPCTITGMDGVSTVGRLYQPDIGNYLYTLNRTEACNTLKLGYIWDGVVMKNATGPNARPVYRLSGNGRHIFTSSDSVKADYINTKGYRDEGISFYVYLSQESGSIPVYGLTKGPIVFYTSAAEEKTYYQNKYGYSSLGVAFMTPALSQNKVVERFSRSGGHLYTVNSQEGISAVSNYGFKRENSGFTADTMPNDKNAPIYRLRGGGQYFFTRDRLERDNAIINHRYLSEGIGFYAPTENIPSVKPIYRLTNYNSGDRLYTPSAVERHAAWSRYGYKNEETDWYTY